MTKEIMICGIDCHKGDTNCNNYCGHDLTKPMPDFTNEATAEMVLARKKRVAEKARMEAEKAWYAYACECDVGHQREYAFEVYERIRTATRIRQ